MLQTMKNPVPLLICLFVFWANSEPIGRLPPPSRYQPSSSSEPTSFDFALIGSPETNKLHQLQCEFTEEMLRCENKDCQYSKSVQKSVYWDCEGGTCVSKKLSNGTVAWDCQTKTKAIIKPRGKCEGGKQMDQQGKCRDAHR